MSSPLEDFEKYAQNIPLTPENAAALNGDERPQPTAPTMPTIVPVGPSRMITDDDRRNLQEMLSLPGWQVYMRIQQKALDHHHANAISVSESGNPLGRATDIAEKWAYWQLYKQAHTEMIVVVTDELRKLREAK
jgi:hypothetical protein